MIDDHEPAVYNKCIEKDLMQYKAKSGKLEEVINEKNT